MHLVYNAEKTGLYERLRANKKFIAIVQKEAYLCQITEGVKHTIYFSYVKCRKCPINPDCDSSVNTYIHKPD